MTTIFYSSKINDNADVFSEKADIHKEYDLDYKSKPNIGNCKVFGYRNGYPIFVIGYCQYLCIQY